MLGLSTITSRISALEQTIERTQPNQPFQPTKLPSLEIGTAPSSNNTNNAIVHHSTILSKLNELTQAFHTLTVQDSQLQSYLASAPTLQAIVDSHASTTLAPPVPAALVSREEEVVLSASGMFQRTATLLEETQKLVGIVDQKWPIEGEFEIHDQSRRHIIHRWLTL